MLFQGQVCNTSYLPRGLGAEVHSSLVNFALSVWLETTPDTPLDPPEKLAFFGQSIKPIFMGGSICSQSVEPIFYGRCHMYRTKSLDVDISDLYFVTLFFNKICVWFIVHKY